MAKQSKKKTIKPVRAWAGVTANGRGHLGIDKQGESIQFGRAHKSEDGQLWAMAVYATRKDARRAYRMAIPVRIVPDDGTYEIVPVPKKTTKKKARKA